MKQTFYILLLALLIVVADSCSKGDVDFSYSPTAPRCGQSILFSNTSTKGDSDSNWEWVFGDGATSTLKSPNKTYREAGVYTVTLTLDGKRYQSATKQITIYDTIPTFTASLADFGTYQMVTFTALTYNPYNRNLSYEWILPNDAVLTDSTETSVTLYFKQADEAKPITLITTLGNIKTEKTITYPVATTPASSILMVTEQGELFRQRIYSDIIAEPEAVVIDGLPLRGVGQMLIADNTMFMFYPLSGEEGAIYAVDLRTNVASIVIKNSSTIAEGLYSTGMVENGYIYFTDKYNKHIYRVASSARNQTFIDGVGQMFAAESMLSGFVAGEGQGIAVYFDLFCLASANGIYRFAESDINSGKEPVVSFLPTDHTPQNLFIDRLAGKIYTIENDCLFIRNIDGSYPQDIDTNMQSVWAVSLSNQLSRIMYAKGGSVWSMPLVQTRNNTTAAIPIKLNTLEVRNMVIDETER